MVGGRISAFCAVILCLVSLQSVPARADHDDGIIQIDTVYQWAKTELDVLIVPPNHGQLYNPENGFLNGLDPNELTPNNSYLVAIEDAIAAWKDGIQRFGAEWLKSDLKLNVAVAGRDEVPSDVPDILVVTDENQGGALGSAIRVVPCVVRMSKLEIGSFNYADMYNVTLQEFGHCLGLSHIGSQGGVEPTSDEKHPEHDPMNGFYTHMVGFGGTHLHCISNIDVLGLEYVFANPNETPLPTANGGSTVFMPLDVYGDTCAPPPPDWRDRLLRLPPLRAHPVSEISTPTHGSIVSSPPAVEGRAAGRDANPLGAAAPAKIGVKVAIARQLARACRWWNAETSRWQNAGCAEPVWNNADGEAEWSLPLPTLLPGNYQVMSKAAQPWQTEPCCTEGRNLVRFTVPSSGRAS